MYKQGIYTVRGTEDNEKVKRSEGNKGQDGPEKQYTIKEIIEQKLQIRMAKVGEAR